MAYPDDLLKDAYHLAGRGGKKPKQSSLRRAVSTAYYAAFHLLVADFVGNWRVPDQRARLARMFEHRRMSGAPLDYADKSYEADYNIGKTWTRVDVTRTLNIADEIFSMWGRLRKEKVAQDHLMSMFGARH